MLSFLINCIKHFGMLEGLGAYIRIKILKSGTLRLPGYKAPVYLRAKSSDITSFREIFFRREYDIDLPPNIRPQVIIDAGANIGYTSLFFLHKFPAAKIFSLEPERENFEILAKNTEHYSLITPIHAALWYKKGVIEVLDTGYGNRGFTVEDSATSTNPGIPCLTITDLIEEYNLKCIDILKIDIEGSEKEVFSSGYETWLPLTNCLIVEIHDRMKSGCSKAVFKAISQYDFSLTLRGENMIFVNNQTVNKKSL